MANYVGSYTLDSGYVVNGVRLRVFRVEIIQGFSSQFGGEIAFTNSEFDRNYLPLVLRNQITFGKACCSSPTNTERHARAYISDTTYLFISCPFRGDSPDFLSFYRELANNPNILFAEAHGETVGREYLLNFANRL